MILSCPMKTFLLGEYLALKGGPTLLACTGPRFELEVTQGQGENPFHPQSPAGKLWASRIDRTANWQARFVSSQVGSGFGGSTAEFLLLWSALCMNESLSPEAQLEIDYFEMLKSYQDLSKGSDSLGVVPSGADLMAQAKGGITHFDRSHGLLANSGWNMPGLSFVLIKTGHKLPTHEHLKTLPEWESERLTKIVSDGVLAFKAQDTHGFVGAVAEASTELGRLGFIAKTTFDILNALSADARVLAAKGCGALGADTVLVLVADQNQKSFCANWSSKFVIAGTQDDLAEGISVDIVGR